MVGYRTTAAEVAGLCVPVARADGAQWQTIDTFDFVGDLSAVWGPSPDDLWAVGSAGAIAHYDGNSWRQVALQNLPHGLLTEFRCVLVIAHRHLQVPIFSSRCLPEWGKSNLWIVDHVGDVLDALVPDG